MEASNEMLAQEAQRGSKDAASALWERVQRLIWVMVPRYYNGHTGRCTTMGVSQEDLYQEGYFSLLDAIKAYQPARRYSFAAYLRYPLQNRFNALCGYRTVRARRDPYLYAKRMEEPIGEERRLLRRSSGR